MTAKRTAALSGIGMIAVTIALVIWGSGGDGPINPRGEEGADPSIVTESSGREARLPIEIPEPAGVTRFGPLQSAPSRNPDQTGPRLAGSAVPTNQWWTSALLSPGSGDLWAMPLVVNARIGVGVEIRTPTVKASPDAVVSSADHGLTLVSDITETRVLGYDAFSLRIEVSNNEGSPMAFTLAQGSPSLTVDVPAGPIRVDTHRPISTPDLDVLTSSIGVNTVDDRHWRVITDDAVLWRTDGSQLVTEIARPTTITFVPTPDDPVGRWDAVADSLASAPVTGTESMLETDWSRRTVRQMLQWHRDGLGAVAVLPHQWASLEASREVLGSFESPRGLVRVIEGSSVTWSTPLNGFIPGVPDTALGEREKAEIAALLEHPDHLLAVGSYFGSKHLARLATETELGRRLGVNQANREELLGETLRNAIDYSGDGDTRWVAYDDTWGGVIVQPAEFGSEDYNDHQFHYGYLIHAAAVVGETDPTFVAEYGPMIDLLVADIFGDSTHPSFPERRGFNPFLGHSYASGYGLFADGNNQESSSEAINAWWAVARWGLVSGQTDIVDTAIAHYAIESATARAYWLGETSLKRPEGYQHRVAGIVWGGKIDFATWFDPRPSAVIGIQLLPVNFGSIYRSDPVSAQQRFDESEPDLLWPDIAAMDLAIADPDRALRLLDEVGQFDDGNSRAFARYWVSSLAHLGPPRSDVLVDSPHGAAFGLGEDLVFVGVNPTPAPIEITFEQDGLEIGRLVLEPGTSTYQRR